MKKYLPLILSLAILAGCRESPEPFPRNVLRYDAPATDWSSQALPVGNGRLGAMVFGNPTSERIQLNEDSMWSGSAEWGDAKGTPEDLERVRNLLREGRVSEADHLWMDLFSHRSIIRSHQTLGDLFIDFEHEATGAYERRLDLDSALVTVQFETSTGTVTERIYSSHPADALIIELHSSAPEGLNFNLRMTRPDDAGFKTASTEAPTSNQLRMTGMATQMGGRHLDDPLQIDHGVQFDAVAEIETKTGFVERHDSVLTVSGAQSVRITLVAATTFYHEDPEAQNIRTLAGTRNQSNEVLLAAHVDDYQAFFNRVRFELGPKGDATGPDSLSMTARLQQLKDGGSDQNWVTKQFQMGRYLLISSSRPGTNPANLQGLWNEYIQAPWNADYHLNINIQMNYWPAEVTNLAELHQPLFDFTERLLTRGRTTAKEQYGMRGAMAHHATDLWAPAWMRANRPKWGAWVGGSGWLAQHLWEHYRFTRDETFLRETAYPMLHDVALFYADWVTKHPEDGKLVSAPSTSPENLYLLPDGTQAATTMGAAMDQQIIKEVFENTLAAASILNTSNDELSDIEAALSGLRSGTVIGPDGRLMEWDQPFEEVEPGHRHMSHLYAFHPGDDITPRGTPELFDAVEKSIEYRLENGGAGTGWSRAWLINMSARRLKGAEVEKHIGLFLQRSIVENMFDMHPPFQIDGNFGVTAGIAEALLQSHAGVIELLPALPPGWQNGRIHGLKARGNVTIDMEWEDGVLVRVNALPAETGEYVFRYDGIETTLLLDAGKVTGIEGMLGR